MSARGRLLRFLRFLFGLSNLLSGTADLLRHRVVMRLARRAQGVGVALLDNLFLFLHRSLLLDEVDG